MLRVTSRVIMAGVCALLWGTPAAVAGAQATATSELEKLRNQFVGSYRLAWYKNYDAAGHETTLPYASGQISFDRAGRMSVFLVGRDRARFGGNSQSESERAAAYASFTSYFGGYDIDPAKRSITYHVEGALNPALTGTDLTRYFEFTNGGATLFLTIKEGDRVVGRLQWDKYVAK